jgi:hypothetical protein
MTRPDTGSDDRPSGRGDAPESDGERAWTNIVIVGFIVFVIGAGLWLVDALLAARKTDECMSSGRRNCSPIDLPAPPQR